MNTDDAPPAPVVPNPWHELRAFTPARIALGRAGISLPTAPQLAFQLAHAQARDAVHRPLDVHALCTELTTLGLATLPLQSAAADRAAYLQRPDRGRQLDPDSRRQLQAWRAAQQAAGQPAADVALVLADGLSSLALQRHAVPVLTALVPLLGAGWTLAPVAVVEQGRVAIGDDVGEALGAQMVVVLIGERPGLSSPDSLGLYITWSPRVGLSDAQRNCISNVRPEGLPAADAARRLAHLLQTARQRQISGVALKDDSEVLVAAPSALPGFLQGPAPA